MTSLLILVLPLVLAQETNPACTRPSGWCTHSEATYSFEDCDGDGILDPVCRDTGGNVGVLSSGNHCIDSWPTGTCLAPASEYCVDWCEDHSTNFAGYPSSGCSAQQYQSCSECCGCATYYSSSTCPNGLCASCQSACEGTCIIGENPDPACTRPSGWCTHSEATYSFEDCDGDGILDPVCRDTGGNVGVLSSGNHCIDSWPTGTCLAPASATYVQCGYLGSPHGGSSGHCKTNAASPSIDWCRNYMRSHTSAIAFRWAELYSSNLGHCFIYFDSSVTACPSGVTWYQNYFLGMTSTFVRDGSCGSGEATYYHAYYYEYLQEQKPTEGPTRTPTIFPTYSPSRSPSSKPSMSPSSNPSFAPTTAPTMEPTMMPTGSPSFAPTTAPTMEPTMMPTMAPSASPSMEPTNSPSRSPSASPVFVYYIEVRVGGITTETAITFEHRSLAFGSSFLNLTSRTGQVAKFSASPVPMGSSTQIKLATSIPDHECYFLTGSADSVTLTGSSALLDPNDNTLTEIVYFACYEEDLIQYASCSNVSTITGTPNPASIVWPTECPGNTAAVGLVTRAEVSTISTIQCCPLLDKIVETRNCYSIYDSESYWNRRMFLAGGGPSSSNEQWTAQCTGNAILRGFFDNDDRGLMDDIDGIKCCPLGCDYTCGEAKIDTQACIVMDLFPNSAHPCPIGFVITGLYDKESTGFSLVRKMKCCPLIDSIPPTVSPSTDNPTREPSGNPTATNPSKPPTTDPSTDEPSVAPSTSPTTEVPTSLPTTDSPSQTPSSMPSVTPTENPSYVPSVLPSHIPSRTPTVGPTTEQPTLQPSQYPSKNPSTDEPSVAPSTSPTTEVPTSLPTTDSPSHEPTLSPTTDSPSQTPSSMPSVTPTENPSYVPSVLPSHIPSRTPTVGPTTEQPTLQPSQYPSKNPTTDEPSVAPSTSPTTEVPTSLPTTDSPSQYPSKNPTTDQPSKNPTTNLPSSNPSTDQPTTNPTRPPSTDTPSTAPSLDPTKAPTVCIPACKSHTEQFADLLELNLLLLNQLAAKDADATTSALLQRFSEELEKLKDDMDRHYDD